MPALDLGGQRKVVVGSPALELNIMNIMKHSPTLKPSKTKAWSSHPSSWSGRHPGRAQPTLICPAVITWVRRRSGLNPILALWRSGSNMKLWMFGYTVGKIRFISSWFWSMQQKHVTCKKSDQLFLPFTYLKLKIPLSWIYTICFLRSEDAEPFSGQVAEVRLIRCRWREL